MGQQPTEANPLVPQPSADVSAATEPKPSDATGSAAADAAADVAVRVPQFAPLQETAKTREAVPLNRFYDVNITVWAELGRVELPISEVLQLSDGAVLKLDRLVSQPVELMAQGVRLARGKVVIVDDCYAIRVTEIEDVKQPTD